MISQLGSTVRKTEVGERKLAVVVEEGARGVPTFLG